MIKDLFSHKLHSSDLDWPEKLIMLATIFAEFDGMPYNRDAIENRLGQVSPRPDGERDASKFRDEFSAYPAYLGLYRLELKSGQWHIFLSETAKKYLLNEEPDVAAFMRLQLSLYQIPNGKGAVYAFPAAFRLQANAAKTTLALINAGVRLSPLRAICKALIADADLRGAKLRYAAVTVGEIAALVNHPPIYSSASPEQALVKAALVEVRKGLIAVPGKFENRFHILNHLELFEKYTARGGSSKISVRSSEDETDALELEDKITTIADLEVRFEQFDSVGSLSELKDVIKGGEWGQYFDALTTLDPAIVNVLAKEWAAPAAAAPAAAAPAAAAPAAAAPAAAAPPLTYPLRKRNTSGQTGLVPSKLAEAADPEITKIKRQRRNLAHRLILTQLEDHLKEKLNADPQETPHIDSFAKIPTNGPFLFEVKSGGEGLLDQVRKAVSQLFEYRFRYKDEIAAGADITLCLVLPERPVSIIWIKEYLCRDLGIAVCWFEKDGSLGYFEEYEKQIEHLLPKAFVAE